jgi:hypothetical protein
VTRPYPTTVLGSGVAATAYALFAARHGPVVLAGAPPTGRARAVESVPAATLTLLLELGVLPREVDAAPLLRRRTASWETAWPVQHDGPACAHLDRGALVHALWRRVAADRRVTVVPRERGRTAAAGHRVDATGARARTAVAVTRRPGAWTAASLTLPRRGAAPDLRLAAAPDGYGYRLGSASLLTLGWVGCGPPPRDGPALWQRIGHTTAELLAALPAPPPEPTHRRPAGLALPVAATDTVPIGDAALTRDALASQGTALALSDACLAADPRTTAAALSTRRAEARDRHVRNLTDVLAACRHADEPAWAAYRRWLAELAAPPADDTRVRTPAVR